MIRSQKSRRDIFDDGWNRYVSNDDGLPDWFVEDERRHYRKELPITKVSPLGEFLTLYGRVSL